MLLAVILEGGHVCENDVADPAVKHELGVMELALQFRSASESTTANAACECDCIMCLSVKLLMLPERCNSPEAFTARGAGVSALSSLDGLMGEEVSGGAERLAALVTFIRPLAGVLPDVHDETGLLRE